MTETTTESAASTEAASTEAASTNQNSAASTKAASTKAASTNQETTVHFPELEEMVANHPSILSSWSEWVQKAPKAVVLSDSLGNDLTLAEIDLASNRVRAWLINHGIGRGDFVLINLTRSVYPVVAILGVLKNRSAFTILESDYAKERVDFIRQDCNAAIDINDDNWAEIMATPPLQEADADQDNDPATAAANDPATYSDHDVCFAVYTSGTTGTPKGVLHEYGQMKLNIISETNADGTRNYNDKSRWALIAPLNFVAAIKTIIHVLQCGAHLFVIDFATVKHPNKLSRYFLLNRINSTFMSPSLIRIKNGDLGPFMKMVYTGAEPANNITINGAELFNLYMMSESLFTVCRFNIDKAYPVVPIGNPLFDLPVKIVNDDGDILADGQTGEFCFANPYCRGYINNPEENAIHFKDGYFHTGDLAVCNDGVFTLKGRADDMVKINGNRIEPSEIEAACNKILGLGHCIAKGFEKEGVVVVYCVERIPADIEAAQEKLAEVLPSYMVPSFFVKIDKAPISSSGKTNRNVLAFPAIARKADYVAPRNEAEKLLCDTIGSILHIDNIGIDDDFFDLGGSSIITMQLLAELENLADNGAQADNLDKPSPDGTVEVSDLVRLTFSHIYKGRTVRGIMGELSAMMHDSLTPEEKEQYAREHPIPLLSFDKVIYPAIKAFPQATTTNMYAAYRIKKIPLLKADRIIKAINDVLRTNSTFQAVIREIDGIPHWCYEPKALRLVELERMSDDDALAVSETFIQGFGNTLDSCLYRIRVIESPKRLYFYFDFSHLLSDGYGLMQFGRDVFAALSGHPNTDNRFFESLYNYNTYLQSSEFEENDRYFTKLYEPLFNYSAFCGKGSSPDTPLTFTRKMFNISINQAELEGHLNAYGITRNIFINAATLCAKSIFNNQPKTMCEWAYSGQDGSTNHTGLKFRVLPVGFVKAPYKSLAELYEDIEVQVQEDIKRGRFFFHNDCSIVKGSQIVSFGIDYLGFIDNENEMIKVGAKPIECANPHDNDIQLPIFVLEVFESSAGFNLRIGYPSTELTHENAGAFIDVLEGVVNTMMKGNLPNLPK